MAVLLGFGAPEAYATLPAVIKRAPAVSASRAGRKAR